MKVLVTGGAGFIGAHVTRALAGAGHEVVALDDFNDLVYDPAIKEARWAALGTGARLVRGTITDAAWLEEFFRTEQFDAVLHLAALPGVGKSWANRERYFEVNVAGTANVLAAAEAAGVAQVIFAGSSSVYDDRQTPFKEDQELRPQSPYGESKRDAEALVAAWGRKPSRSATVLRFFTVYGPWGRPDMAPWIFTEAILRGQPLAVTREPRSRDFTFVDDIVKGIVAALNKQLPGFEIINLGRGMPVELRDLIAAVERAAGKTAVITDRPTPPGEMRITYADIAKGKQRLGYEPSTSVEEGMVQVVDWMRVWLASRT